MLEVYVTLVVFIAFAGQALFGFGGGIVAVPLLTFRLEVRDAVVLTSLFQFLIGALVFRNLASIPWRLVLPVVLGMVCGVPVGVACLGVLEPEGLRWLLAFFIVAFLIQSRWYPGASVASPSLLVGGISGACSGFFQGCIGVGGPNLVIYLRRLVSDQSAFRAAMIFLLSVANLLRVVQGSMEGMFSPGVLRLGFIALPFFVVGVVAGQRYYRRVPEGVYNTTINVWKNLQS
jgi:uncharacterized membrane protein YfcA